MRDEDRNERGLPPTLARSLKARLRLARLALFWESLWPALWPALGIAGLFLAIALFDVLPLLPPWLHALTLAALLTAFGTALWRGLSRVTLPDRAAARRRVERDSGLAHRPLASLDDDLAGGRRDAVARGLWQVHLRRMAAAVGRLRVAMPAPGLPARDPLGLRAGVLLLLFVAVAGTWDDMAPRLQRAISPALAAAPTDNAFLQVWLTPPDYTGVAPALLEWPSQAPARELTIPAGSAVMALLQGGEGRARLVAGDAETEFRALGDGSQRVEARLQEGQTLAVEQGRRRLAEWSVAVVRDAPPAIGFLAPPDGDPAGRLRLAYQASDDYGVTKAWAAIRRVGDDSGREIGIELPIGGRAREVRQASRHDLTAHEWAGLPVRITPMAADAAGQTGFGEAVNTVLPERHFTHPVARALIEQRRHLVESPRRRAPVMGALDALSAAPEAFGHDAVVYLAMRMARSRLRYDLSPEAIPAVRDLMWDTALAVEDGDRALAERAIEAAMEDLEKAIAEGAPQAEIDRLMRELQNALDQYMKALVEQAMQEDMQPFPLDPQADTVTARELSQMLQQMREMARIGSREAAQQMLSELRNMLQNLQAGMRGMNQMQQGQRQSMQALKDLQELARRQQELMDRSFGRSQQPRQASGDRAADAEDAAAQEQLRKALGEIMRQLGEGLGEIPEGLGQAEQAMRDATGALGQNMPGIASESQGEALDMMRRGANGAMQALSEQMRGQGMPGGFSLAPSTRRDPLGRRIPNSGIADDGSVHVPDEAEIHRAQEVLDELRRRLGDPKRPEEEQEYLRRLLRQF